MDWLMKREIKIRNKSRKTISLISFSRPNGVDFQSEFNVRKAQDIPAGGSVRVKLQDYDSSGTGPGSQIYMLFRAEEIPKTVKPRAEDKLFLYTKLGDNKEWELSLDQTGQVIGGPDDATGQTSSGANAAGSRDESPLERLTQMVEALEKRVKALETALEKSGII